MKTFLCVFLFLFSSMAWALPNDQYGRVVSKVTQSGNDVYTVSGSGATFTVSYPTGTAQSQVYNSINSQAPAGYTPPAPLMSQSMTPTQFGQYLITQFTAGNASRGLSTSQIATLTAMPIIQEIYFLLQTGALQTTLTLLPSIPVDGVIITSATITQFTQAIQAYEAGLI